MFFHGKPPKKHIFCEKNSKNDPFLAKIAPKRPKVKPFLNFLGYFLI